MAQRRRLALLLLPLLALPLGACTTIGFTGTGKLDEDGLETSSELKLTPGGNVKGTLAAFSKLAADTGGLHFSSARSDDVPMTIKKIIYTGIPERRPLDLVFVVDTTGSMANDIAAVRTQLRSIQDVLAARNPDHRIGLVAYRDRGDVYLSQTVLALSAEEGPVRAAINSLEVGGGGDFPEHVYAGLATALTDQPWRPNATQHIVLLGDAPPHDYDNDPHTRASVLRTAKSEGRSVKVHAITLSCGRLCRTELGL